MNQPASQTAPRPSPPLLKALLGDKHFLIASVILAVTAGGWKYATDKLKLTTLKDPVPWPAGVTVGEGFRFRSLAGGRGLDEFGPFKAFHPIDELIRMDPNLERRREDASFNKWEVIESGNLETLRIGTAVDVERYGDRKSNWYMVRYYEDTRPQAPVRTWRLEIYYYTGEADTVPHIPDICAQASGATILASDADSWEIPAAPAPWAKSVPFHRTRYQFADGSRSAAYYVFSMNGRLSDSRTWVRWELLNPFLRYAYFAKVQFSPVVGTSQSEETDRAAKEFMQFALPEVLRAFPSSQDVQALEQSP